MNIESVKFLNEDNVEEREIEITLDNGTTIHACACYESWQQWGGTTDELWVSMPIVEANNDWLHGYGEPQCDY